MNNQSNMSNVIYMFSTHLAMKRQIHQFNFLLSIHIASHSYMYTEPKKKVSTQFIFP